MVKVNSNNLAYRPGLDGVRAIAVAGVILYHGQVGLFSGGFLGVDVFFVLSGFLITSLLLREHQLTGAIRLGHFWMGRIRRLVPAALVVIVVSLLVVAIFSRADLRLLKGDALASVFYVNNWHQVFAQRSYFETFGRPSLLQHFWSLAVEEQFYLLWPLLLLAGFRFFTGRTIAWITAAAALASAVLMWVLFNPDTDATRVYFGTDTRALPILIGATMAFFWPSMLPGASRDPRGRTALTVIGAAGLLIVVAGMVGLNDYQPFVFRGGLLIVALGAAMLIASASHPASAIGDLLGTRVLVWVGRRSYGIYLWHWPVMAMSRPEIDFNVSLWILVPAQVAVTLLAAELSYRYVEMPIRTQALQRRLRAWWARSGDGARRAVAIGAPACALALVLLLAAWPAPRTPARERAARSSGDASAKLKKAKATTPTTATTATAPRRPVLMVGASVMLEGASLLEKGPLKATVDAADSRQHSVIIERLRAYRAEGTLPPVVVVQTGENGPLTDQDLQDLKDALRGVPRVVIMNLRYPGESWIDATNEQLKALVAGWPQARIADWRSASEDPSLLWDGTHPNEQGQAAYERVVREAIDGNP